MADFSKLGGAEPVHSPTRGEDRLPVDPNAPFILQHHPNKWSLGVVEIDGEDKDVWLPVLSPLWLKPGVNRVRSGGPGAPPDATLAAAQQKKLGFIVLEHQSGHALLSFLREDDARGPRSGRLGTYHRVFWEQPHVTAAGRYSPRFDERLGDAWRFALMTEGLIPPPDAEIIEELTERLQRAVDRQATQTSVAGASPGLKRQLNDTEVRLERAQKALVWAPSTSEAA